MRTYQTIKVVGRRDYTVLFLPLEQGWVIRIAPAHFNEASPIVIITEVNRETGVAFAEQLLFYQTAEVPDGLLPKDAADPAANSDAS